MTRAAFERFMGEFTGAWASQDLDRMAAAFAPEATYADTPFSPAHVGRDAIRRYNEIILTQADAQAGFEVLGFDEASRSGVGNWWIEYRVRPRAEWPAFGSDPAGSFAAIGLDPERGNRLRQNGVAFVKLDAEGLATEFREWWHTEKLGPA